ncbi:MAG: hypothetical protein KatS3mg077_2564 [Candidatus Binatia bacterium]|nr:MAG: hypothetical protein KatS3mg077_2564 [Candidatus Binatia bacterium]
MLLNAGKGEIDRSRPLWLISPFAAAGGKAAGAAVVANAATDGTRRGNDETDIPTPQSQTQTDTRFSCADGNTRRPRRTQAPAGEGTQTSHGDDSAQATQPAPRVKAKRFPKDLRLRRREDFLRVQSQGKRRVRGGFVVLSLPREEPGPSRIGITASRKVGRAVVRNRVKRLVREFFRQYGDRITSPTDIVVIVRPQAAQASYEEVKRDLASALGIRC